MARRHVLDAELDPHMHTDHILVLGLGISGLAAAELALMHGRRVTVLDERESTTLHERMSRLQNRGVRVELLWNRDNVDDPVDLAVISPGIAADTRLGRLAAGLCCPVVSEIEFAFRYCSCPVIAVTGTNGKTTTVDLTAHCLRHAGYKVLPAGNNGYPLSEAVLKSADLDALVVEVSSFQLERIEKFAPRVAAVLNVTPDHLDRYPDLHAYCEAKARIALNLRHAGQLVLHEDVASIPEVQRMLPDRGRPVLFSSSAHSTTDYLLSDDVTLCRQHHGQLQPILQRSELRLVGRHNLENVMAAIALCEYVGADPAAICEGVRTFTPSPHRLELVTVQRGVTYINDSKATNPDAMLRAVEAMRERTAGRIILIAGGLDKSLDFTPVGAELSKCVHEIFLFGSCRKRLAKQWEGVVSCKPCTSLEACVDGALEMASPGDTVLFSPGCASQDMFTDYAERGRNFCDLITRKVGE